MRIGRRPDERHNAVILDLFGSLNSEEDRAVLIQALQRDEKTGAILLQLEELRAISEHSVTTLQSLVKAFSMNGKRLILVRPRGEVLNRLTTRYQFEIVENEPDAFKPEVA